MYRLEFSSFFTLLVLISLFLGVDSSLSDLAGYRIPRLRRDSASGSPAFVQNGSGSPSGLLSGSVASSILRTFASGHVTPSNNLSTSRSHSSTLSRTSNLPLSSGILQGSPGRHFLPIRNHTTAVSPSSGGTGSSSRPSATLSRGLVQSSSQLFSTHVSARTPLSSKAPASRSKTRSAISLGVGGTSSSNKAQDTASRGLFQSTSRAISRGVIGGSATSSTGSQLPFFRNETGSTISNSLRGTHSSTKLQVTASRGLPQSSSRFVSAAGPTTTRVTQVTVLSPGVSSGLPLSSYRSISISNDRSSSIPGPTEHPIALTMTSASSSAPSSRGSTVRSVTGNLNLLSLGCTAGVCPISQNKSTSFTATRVGTGNMSGLPAGVSLAPLTRSSSSFTSTKTGTGDSNFGSPPIIPPIVPPVVAPPPPPAAPPGPGFNNDPSNKDPDKQDPDNQNTKTEDPEKSPTKTTASVPSTSLTRTTSSSLTTTSMTSRTSTSTSSPMSSSSTGGCMAFSYVDEYPFPLPDDGDPNSDGLDWADDDFDDENDDGSSRKMKRTPSRTFEQYRAIAGRVAVLDERDNVLMKRGKTNRKITTAIGTCTGLASFIVKPSYPVAKVVKFEENRPEPTVGQPRATAGADMKPFLAQAAYWALPQDTPPGSCAVPTWDYKETTEAESDVNPWQIGGDAQRAVNVDHIYETHFLGEFFNGLLQNNKIDCGIVGKIFDQADNSPDAPKDALLPGNPTVTRLGTLFQKLATYENPEFVGMANVMNNLKARVVAKVWKPNTPLQFSGVDAKTGFAVDAGYVLRNYIRIAMLLDVANDPKAVALFEKTNARIYKAFQSIDQLGLNCGFGLDPTFWADSYKDYFMTRLTTLNTRIQELLHGAIDPINPQEVPGGPDYLAAVMKKYPLESAKHPIPQDWNAGNPVVNIGKRQAGAASVTACPKRAPTTATAVDSISSSRTQRLIPTGNLLIQSLGVGAPGNSAVLASGTGQVSRISSALKPSTVATTPLTNLSPTSSTKLGADTGILGGSDSSPPPKSPTPVTTPLTSLPSTTTVTSTSSSSSPSSLLSVTTVTPSSSTTPLSSPLSATTITPQSSTATSPPSTVSSPLPAHSDPCGPVVQEPGYPDTCSAKVSLVTTPSQYGVYCGSSGSTQVTWSSCYQMYFSICLNIGLKDFPHDAWVWIDGGNGCAVGAWMPGVAGAAEAPSSSRCSQLIYQAMVDTCAATSGSNVASVNLASLPSFGDTSEYGSQVNAGYMSFIVAPRSPLGLKKTWAGWTTADPDSIGQGAAMDGPNPNQQAETPKGLPPQDETA